MKKRCLIAALCLLLLVSGCKRRDQVPTTPPESVPDAVTEDAPEPQESPAEEQPKAIEDPEQIEQARQIVTEALERAALADEIYRGLLRWNEVTPATVVEEQHYRLVLDERFQSPDDIQAHLDKTFTAGGRAADRFAEMNEARLYMSVNGELHLNTTAIDPPRTPLLLGSWEVSGMRLLEMDADRIVVLMPTKRMNSADGDKELVLVRSGESWLLDDSYFFA